MRGSVLGVLAIGMAAALLALSLAGLAVQQLSLQSRVGNLQRARAAAESATALAVDQLLADHLYGQPGTPGYDVVVRYHGTEEQGLLTFHPDRATELGLPLSRNQLARDVPTEGWRRLLPAESIQLVGQGTCHGVTAQVEVILHAPPFPYVIASTGPFTSTGGLLVGRLDEEKGLAHIEADDLLPGHLVSNKDVQLGPQSVVTGDVQAHGDITLEPGAAVRGEVRAHVEPVKIPKLVLSEYRPDEGRAQRIDESSLAGPSLEGYLLKAGTLDVTGGLTLKQGVLYVEGDLHVTGGIEGKGALIVTGNLTVEGGAALSTDNKVAVLAGGNVTIHGDGLASSFRGLVYTEGDFRASDVTVVGSFVGNKAEGSEMVLEDARLVEEPGPVVIAPPTYVYAWDYRNKRVAAQTVLPPAGQPFSAAKFRVFNPDGTYADHPPEDASDYEGGPHVQVLRAFYDTLGVRQNTFEHPVIGTVSNQGDFGPLIQHIISYLNEQASPTGSSQFVSAQDALVLINLRNAGIVDQLASFPRPANAVDPETFSLDQFLAPSDRLRVLLWEVH